MKEEDWTVGSSKLVSYLQQQGGKVGIVELQRAGMNLRSMPKLEKHQLAKYCDTLNEMHTAVMLTAEGLTVHPPFPWMKRSEESKADRGGGFSLSD